MSMRASFLLGALATAAASALLAMSAAAAGTADILRTERQQQAADVLAKLDEANIPTREQFVSGSVSFAVHHELGHFLQDEYKFPNLAFDQEGMADIFATVELGPQASPSEMQGAIRLWLYYAYMKGATPVKWWDEHGLDHQRAFRIGCFLTGRWPNRYAGLPEAFGAPPRRAAICTDESRESLSGWVEALRSKSAVMIDRQKTVVNYYPGHDEFGDDEKWLRASAILEGVATEIQRYRLPDWRIERRAKVEKDMAEGRFDSRAFNRTRTRVEVIARSCGEANAFYTPPNDRPNDLGLEPRVATNPTITLCYELIDQFHRLAVKAGLPESM